jgi:xanthine permease XanP
MLNTIFPPFSEVRREKPRDMLFIAHEKPDMMTTIVAASQHVLIILMLTVYVVFVGREIGFTGAHLRSFVSIEIVVVGIVTLLQSLKTRFSSGHLVVHAPNLMSMAALGAVVLNFGLGAAAGAYILSGILVIIFARFLPKLQKLFPPEVTGILLVLLGLTLVRGGAAAFTGFKDNTIDWTAFLVAATTLGTIVVISIWTSEKVRVFALGFGIVAGIGLAVILGVFGAEHIKLVASQPFIAQPFEGYSLPRPTLVFGAVLPLLIIEIISAVGSIGRGVAVDKLNNAKWRRSDLPMIGRLVMCQGIGVLLNGLTGTPSTTMNSANIGLAHSTGVAARRVGVAAGIIFIVVACLPMLSTFITIIPRPVMGAIIIYTASFLVVTGMQMILSRMINNRRMFMVGISITVGAAIILMPELTSTAPANLKPILGSGLTMGFLTAVILNLIFRIGIVQTDQITLTGPEESSKATRFLEDCGISWGARHDVIARAGQSVVEAMESLHEGKLMEGPANLKATFDEYEVVLTLNYPGRGTAFAGSHTVDLKKLMEESEGMEALDAAMSTISTRLIQKLADVVKCDEAGGRATLYLQFIH